MSGQTTATSFEIEVPTSTVSELIARVRSAQVPKLSQGAGWKYGVDAIWFSDLRFYWASDYSWAAAQQRLNRYEHFQTVVEGRRLHFVKVGRTGGAAARHRPAVLLHGRPYTFAAMLPLADRLAQAGYDVIAAWNCFFQNPRSFDAKDAATICRTIANRHHVLERARRRRAFSDAR